MSTPITRVISLKYLQTISV